MNPFRTIELAIDLAARQRDALARKHEQAHRHLDHAQHQLAQLKGYAAETDNRWGNGQSGNLSAEMLRHHYQFRDRLQHAADLQVNAVAQSQAQRDAAHQALMHAEYRLAGLRQVLTRRRAAENLVEQRREQRTMDEFAAQRHRQQVQTHMMGDNT